MASNRYSEQYKDPRWQKLRLVVLNRDEWKCVICGDEESTLNVHHPVYHPDAENIWDYDEGHLITLCKNCHENEHDGLSSAKSSVLLALAKIGFNTVYEYECLTDIFSAITKEDLVNLFLEKSNGTNQNS